MSEEPSHFLRLRHVTLPMLARDIVLGLGSATELAFHYGIEEDEWGEVKASPFFRAEMQRALADAKGRDNRVESIRAKAQHAIDSVGITEITGMMVDAEMTSSVRLEAFKRLSEVAGVNRIEGGAAIFAGQPLVVIQLGNEQHPMGGNVIKDIPRPTAIASDE